MALNAARLMIHQAHAIAFDDRYFNDVANERLGLEVSLI